MHLGNYYHATRAVELETPSLEGGLATDVAIIGGGITGVSAALHLAERGYKVALLEGGETIGWGASGRNGGQVLPGFGAAQAKLKSLVGAATARKLWDMSVEAVDLLHMQINRFAIPCNPVQGYLHPAIKPRQLEELKGLQEELAELGAPVGRILQGEELRARLASPRYIAALEDRIAGHIHPFNYTLGLGRAAQAAGARLFTGTLVERVEPGPIVTLHTAHGTVTAAHLFIAGGAYLGGLMRPMANTIMPVGTYIIATEPRADAASLIPNNEAVADMNFVLDYFRRSADDRILFGGRVSYSTLPPPQPASRFDAAAGPAASSRSWPTPAWTTCGAAMWTSPATAPRISAAWPATSCSRRASPATALPSPAWPASWRRRRSPARPSGSTFSPASRMPAFPGGRAFRTPALLLATTYYRLRDLL